jgi:hypothetical protein
MPLKRYKKGVKMVCTALRRRLSPGSRSDRIHPAPLTGDRGLDNTGLRIDLILPRLTDLAIDRWLEPHCVVFNPDIPVQGNLFLFLSGSYGHPGRQSLIVQAAAAMGYPAINLRYPNFWTVGGLCQNSPDPDCHAKVRREIIYGVDSSPKIEINAANSIQNRLVKLLQYLHRQYPEQGWLKYLEGETPQWQSMVVAGHSQGGGHAAMIAKEQEVARVIMFGAPADTCRGNRSLASWISTPNATPCDRYFGFVHIQDQGFKKIQQAWQRLGMDAYGSMVDVDKQSPPYLGSHQLVTAARPARPGKYHASVVVDHSTPTRVDGTPLFQEAWQYLFGK